jgi:uncharacterized membrane protein
MTPQITLAAMIGSGLIAGTFLAFSSFIMRALAQQPHPAGMAAMQAINLTVINPLFLAVLFGTAVLSVWLGWVGWSEGRILLVAGAVLYVVGVIGVTVVFNVPLNTALAAATQDASSATLWADYVTQWTRWNTVRMIAAMAACGCFGWGMR